MVASAVPTRAQGYYYYYYYPYQVQQPYYPTGGYTPVIYSDPWGGGYQYRVVYPNSYPYNYRYVYGYPSGYYPYRYYYNKHWYNKPVRYFRRVF